jgi:hypothetical protein
MTGKLGKYTWAVDAAGWTTVWVGPKENDETLCDGLVRGEPEEAILSVITSNEMFEKKWREKLNEFIVNQDPCPSRVAKSLGVQSVQDRLGPCLAAGQNCPPYSKTSAGPWTE